MGQTLLEYSDGVWLGQKDITRVAKCRARIARGGVADTRISRFRTLVGCMVRTLSADVGGRAAKGQCRGVFLHRLDIWNRVLFRHMLVANLRSDPLRRIPMATGVFPDAGRVFGCRHISRPLYRDTRRADPEVRFLGIRRRTVRLGIYRISALLADGE